MKFRDIVEGKKHQDLTEAVVGVNDTGIGYIIPYTLQFIAQVHVWHFLCKSGQKHAALGELYEGLQEEVDGLAEKFIAQGGVLQTVAEPLVAYYDEELIRQRIDQYRNMVTSAINSEPAMASIVDGVTDLQQIVDSALYKFNLQ